MLEFANFNRVECIWELAVSTEETQSGVFAIDGHSQKSRFPLRGMIQQ